MNRRDFIITTAVAATWPLTAAGYLLSPHKLVQFTNRRLSGVRGLEATLVGETRTAEGPLSIGERWGFRRGIEMEVKGPNGRQAKWRTGGVETGHIELLPMAAIRPILGHLFGDADLNRLLLSIGADLNLQRLALDGERVAHVLGVATKVDRRPQVWIEQDTFDVMRVLFPGPNGLIDLRLEGWAGPVTQGRFPHRIRIFEGGRWMRRLETDAVLTGR